MKQNEQSLQEIWDYIQRPNLQLIAVPERDRKNRNKLENTFQDVIQENFPNLASQHANSENTENITEILHEKINSKTHNHQILKG